MLNELQKEELRQNAEVCIRVSTGRPKLLADGILELLKEVNKVNNVSWLDRLTNLCQAFNENRCRIFRVGQRDLAMMMSGGLQIIPDWPADAELITIITNQFASWSLLFAHHSFEPVPHGEDPPSQNASTYNPETGECFDGKTGKITIKKIAKTPTVPKRKD